MFILLFGSLENVNWFTVCFFFILIPLFYNEEYLYLHSNLKISSGRFKFLSVLRKNVMDHRQCEIKHEISDNKHLYILGPKY